MKGPLVLMSLSALSFEEITGDAANLPPREHQEKALQTVEPAQTD
jgi:hypothetical protein